MAGRRGSVRIRLARTFRWRALPLAPRLRRQVLLVSGAPFETGYAEDFWRLFQRDPRLRFSFTAPRHYGGRVAAATRLGLPLASFSASQRRWWDLAVFADHIHPFEFDRAVPKLRLQHGLAGGKRRGGVDCRYDPRQVLRDDGTSAYELIFEASGTELRRAVAQLPALDGRIALVGDLRADRLLARRAERTAVRRAWGFTPDHRVVCLASTWGAASLVDAPGEALFDAAERLMRRGRWTFIVTVHPHEWAGGGSLGRGAAAWLRGLRRRGFTVVEPDGDLDGALLASDALVADHTSVLALFALLGKPIVSVPVPEQALDPESVLARIRQLGPQLSDVAELEPCLWAAFSRYPRDALTALAPEIDAHPGEAANRMAQTVYGLLSLAPPVADATASSSRSRASQRGSAEQPSHSLLS